MKKILLLGDSIRLNYAPYVFRKLGDKAEIVWPEDNCRFAKYTLHELPGWLKRFGIPDIIHWNNGLWDAHHYNLAEPLTPLNEYVRDLEKVAAILKSTGAHIIFATCTTASPVNKEWDNHEIATYNAAACRLMERINIPVNDLYSVTKGHEDICICEDLIHLSPQGIKMVGEQVVKTLEKHL
ncbi:MAG: SGNH/GDSL hydrolase family protein [Clostridia bacterium]|nr:SGNH/GDSL hydrolase family protein [Clostridia bacterium]